MTVSLTDTDQNQQPTVLDDTLLLVDGSSYLYRAFHALPDMRNPQGEATGAVYGLINMLRKLRQTYNAKYGACIFDAKGKTFREDIYPDYKGHRSPMPDALVQQIEPIHQVVKALGWPLLIVPGVEADDVIGTLACRARSAGLNTIISTGDKDLAQLVNSHVMLVNTMTGEELGVQGVIDKFGVPAERIVDYLSLIGDSVDNVPGVNKVGPKTALKWLAEYDSLHNIMAHANEIKGAVGEHLRAAIDWLPTARTLLTIKTDCDLTEYITNIEALAYQTPDQRFLYTFFQRQGFRTWLKELSKNTEHNGYINSAELSQQEMEIRPIASVPVLERAYETVLTERQLEAWLEKISQAPLTCIDTETTSLDPLQASLVGISLSVEAGAACYIPLTHTGPEEPQQLNIEYVLTRLKPWLESEQALKVGQNLKYDAHILQNHGIQLNGIAHDTLLQSYILESHRNHDMDSLAERHLGEATIKYTDICGKGAQQIRFDQVTIAEASAYAAEDADITLRLHQHFWPHLIENEKLRFVYQQIEIPTLKVLQKVERHGVLLDTAKLQVQSADLEKQLRALETEVYTLAEQAFNLNSPKQVGEILFSKLQLPVVKKTASGTPSTDEEVLQKLALDYPLPKLLLDYRGLAKLKSTYTDKLPRMINPATGRVHTNYAQAVAVTGRLTSNDPNLQNIPVRTAEGRRIREAFIAAPKSVLVSIDYSQIELRIMAHLSADNGLLSAFAEGRDIHRATAAEIFAVTLDGVTNEQRRYAKVINFGLIYGMSAFGLASNLGIERNAAQHYIDTYFARYPGVAHYMQLTREQAKADGYVETVFGRRLWLPEINGANGPRRQAAERAAINAPMQGTAADLIKLSMVAVQAWLEQHKMLSKIVMQVHDELVLEVPESELEQIKQHVPNLMCNVAQLKVPLVVSVGYGKNWEEAH
jgi:DNA polymerase-1